MSGVERNTRLLAKAIQQGAIEMYRLRTKERLSYPSIAKRCGCSRERVKQVLALYCRLEGLPYPGKYKGR